MEKSRGWIYGKTLGRITLLLSLVLMAIPEKDHALAALLSQPVLLAVVLLLLGREMVEGLSCWGLGSREDSVTERKSGLTGMAATLLIIFVCIYDYAHLEAMLPRDTLWNYAAIFLLVLGIGIRTLTIRTLGEFFTHTVTIRAGHRIVKTGPYRYVRHPCYLGLAVIGLSIPLALSSVYGLVLFWALGIPLLQYRMRLEEGVLMERFGEEYEAYRRETKRIIPFLW